MKHRKITLYPTSFTEIEFCGNSILEIKTDGVYELPFPIEPTDNSHDYKNCPKCQKTVKSYIKNFQAVFEGTKSKKGFPYCCKWHANLSDLENFDRNDFTNVPEISAYKILYTCHQINDFQNKRNWFDEITNYIDYVIESFGKMPKGYGSPFLLSHFFTVVIKFLEDNLLNEKGVKIIEYINSYREPTLSTGQKISLKTLIDIYRNWLDVFPFEFSIFSHAKTKFQKMLPLAKSTPQFNPYLGLAKSEMHSKESLISFLVNLTNQLVTEINTFVIYQKGELNEPEKIKIELAIEQRKLELKRGYLKNNSVTDKKNYEEILLRWFEDENRFMNRITPVLKALPLESKKVLNENELTELEQIKQSKNQFWKGLPMNEVVKHFEKMTMEENDKGQPFLTKEQFIKFLKRGFLGDKSQPKQVINSIGVPKQDIIRIFFDFYQIAVVYGHKKRHKNFIDLIFECFTNWKEEERSTIKRLFKPKI
jgi:hypothetical protein